MKRELVISHDRLETRVAVIEDGRLAEYHTERPQDAGLTGNIYRGRVVRVLPGMQAAFVDIGVERPAYLFAGDAQPEGPRGQQRLIEDIVRPGCEILVQVEKEPGPAKGAKVSTRIALAGRYVVLFPGRPVFGVSHRVNGDDDRSRLKETLAALAPEGSGLIARTAAHEADPAAIAADVAELSAEWRSIEQRSQSGPVPAVIYRPPELALRIVRDFIEPGIAAVICDSEPLMLSMKELVGRLKPALLPVMELHRGLEPAADRFGLDDDIRLALARRVWLRSGGYLVIDSGEAMTAIDVNTGKHTGKRDFEETITRTNLEAAREIARQLRLRNLGGIIVIDFIDMQKTENRERVRKELSDALAADRARCTITRISELGLVEMTRKRVRDSLTAQLEDVCSCCEGTGRTISPLTVARDILRQVRRSAAKGLGPNVVVHAHPAVVDRLTGADLPGVEELEAAAGLRLAFKGIEAFHPERFEVMPGRESTGRRRLK
ncbi:MAG: Rne/Rng family ribonuclease [Deltaproteobacteria bacterium]|nr:Rne/Rng family ribonuclease [Deltaproteobacteria bacterium]